MQASMSGVGYARFKSQCRFFWFHGLLKLLKLLFVLFPQAPPPSERDRGAGNPKVSQDDAGEGELRLFNTGSPDWIAGTAHLIMTYDVFSCWARNEDLSGLKPSFARDRMCRKRRSAAAC